MRNIPRQMLEESPGRYNIIKKCYKCKSAVTIPYFCGSVTSGSNIAATLSACNTSNLEPGQDKQHGAGGSKP